MATASDRNTPVAQPADFKLSGKPEKDGSPADAGLPGFHGWAYWGAGSHPRQSGLFDLDNLANEDQVWILDRLLVQLPQALPAALHVVTLGDLVQRVAPLYANGLVGSTSTVLLWSRLLGDLLRRVARLLGCGRSRVGRRRRVLRRFAVRLRQSRTSAAGWPGPRTLAC